MADCRFLHDCIGHQHDVLHKLRLSQSDHRLTPSMYISLRIPTWYMILPRNTESPIN